MLKLIPGITLKCVRAVLSRRLAVFTKPHSVAACFLQPDAQIEESRLYVLVLITGLALGELDKTGTLVKHDSSSYLRPES